MRQHICAVAAEIVGIHTEAVFSFLRCYQLTLFTRFKVSASSLLLLPLDLNNKREEEKIKQ